MNKSTLESKNKTQWYPISTAPEDCEVFECGCTRSHPHENISEECEELTVEAREEFQEYNRQGPQYILGDYNTALCTWFACKSYQEYKQSSKEKG